MIRTLRKACFTARLLAIKAFRHHPYPLYANLVVNSRCNLRCVYCFGGYPDRREREYTFEEIQCIVDELHAMGTRYILVQGGEPFLRRDLGDVIEYIDRKGILVAVVSNGTLTRRIADCRTLDRLDNLCFSLDGMPAGNDRQRGRDVFTKVLRSVDDVRARHPAVKIRINAVITRHTVDEFIDFLRLCWARGLEVQIGALFKDSLLAADSEKVRAIFEFAYGAKKRGARIVASSSVLRYVADWPFDSIWVSREAARARLGRRTKECHYGRYFVVVDSDGAVYPCNALQGTFAPKRLREVPLADALRHLRTKPCYTCNIPAMLDTSEIVNWNLGALVERVRLEWQPRRATTGRWHG